MSRCLFRGMAALLVAAMLAGPVPTADAASHREAPLVALDPTADITDVYAFRSWENDSKAVFIMNVIPQQVPASGPNFFNLAWWMTVGAVTSGMGGNRRALTETSVPAPCEG